MKGARVHLIVGHDGDLARVGSNDQVVQRLVAREPERRDRPNGSEDIGRQHRLQQHSQGC